MNISIVGAGCDKYFELLKLVRCAMSEKKCNSIIKEINERKEIIESGVINCPALIINGKIICQGDILTKDEIMNAMNSIE